jgi:hypothetical protein
MHRSMHRINCVFFPLSGAFGLASMHFHDAAVSQVLDQIASPVRATHEVEREARLRCVTGRSDTQGTRRSPSSGGLNRDEMRELVPEHETRALLRNDGCLSHHKRTTGFFKSNPLGC